MAGVLLGGIQLVPSIDALSHSTRQSADAAFATSGSLHPLNLVQVVAPYLFATRVVGQNTHELGLYFGAVPLLLCGLAVGSPPRVGRLPAADRGRLVGGRRSRCCWPLANMGSAARWQQYLPLVGKFRFPCRSIVWVYAAVALLAAIAWQRLVEAPRPLAGQRRARRCGIVGGAVCWRR